MLLDGLPGRRSDRSDFEMKHRLSTQVKLSQPLPQRVDSVDAGQNEPVVLGEISQGSIQRSIRPGLADLDEGNLKNLRA